MLAAQVVQALDEWHAIQVLAVQSDGNAMFELYLYILGGVGGLDRIDGPGEGVFGRLDPRIFKDARLAASSPEIQVDAVRAFLGRFHGDAMLGGELDLLVAGHLPFADRGDDSESRVERLERDVETHLVVALAGA